MRYLLTNVLTYSLTQVFNASTARSWSSEVYNPCPGVMEGVPASRDYEGGFSHELMLKDLSLALRAAADAGASESCRTVPADEHPHHVVLRLPAHTLCTPLEGAPAPSCEHAMRLYTMSAASGMAAKDFGGAFVK